MVYKVTVDGVDVTKKMVDEGVSLSHVEFGNKRCSLKLYEQLYSMGDELLVYRDDIVIFQGDIEKETIKPGIFTAYASDQLLVLSDQVARHEDHREYVETEYTDIFKDLLSYYFSGIFDVTNMDDSGLTCGYIDLKDKPISECARVLAKRANMVFWLEPPNYLYFKTVDSVASDYTIIYGQNVQNISVTRDNFVKTKVIVRMKLGEVVVGTGERTTIVADDTITMETDATDLGNAILQEMQDIQIRGDITLVESRSDLIPGTTVVFHAPQFGFENEVVRIKSVIVTPFSTKLTVGVMTSLAEDKQVDFETRLKRMENRGIDWRVSCDTRMQTAPGCTGPCENDCQVTCEVLSTCVTACQDGICQSSCQQTVQLLCITTEQVCGTSGTCQVACEDGHKCESTCESQCQIDCQMYCQGTPCETACQTDCQTSCQATCETSCLTGCETSCQTGCETSCQTTCQTTCQTECELTGCEATCEVGCEIACETACKVGCRTESLCCGTIGPD